jgi:hypothetical protein
MQLYYITKRVVRGYWVQVFQIMPNNGGLLFLREYLHNPLDNSERVA